ncbi:MAG: hypothetical protein ACE5JR_09925 [Gemmatimonadota bacterium]
MPGFKRFIGEIHRRSLWQVLGIYAVGSWVVLQVVETLTESLSLPEWVPPFALVLLLIGLPIVLATAFVQEGTATRDVTAKPALGRGTTGGASAGYPADTEVAPHRGPPAPRAGRVRRFLTWRNTITGGVIGFALWGVAVTGWLVLAPKPQLVTEGSGSGAASARVAVFPFAMRGSEDYAYLGEGIVDLLSTKLDGAGDLRSVDPRALLAVVEREEGRVPNPEASRSIAERFAAGLYVLGDILEAGGRLRIHASLYDAAAGREAVGQGTAEGEADQIFELVDDVAAQLLGARAGGPGTRMARIAAVTTHSLPALRAYLEGEKFFRSGNFERALDAFQRATAEDSTFALAWYRLSIAAEWHLSEADLVREAAERAARFGDRLSEHGRRLLDAFQAARQGASAEAERLYRGIVANYPDDFEAWFQLAEVLFHYGPLRGRSVVDSRDAWQRVLELQPDDIAPLIHLARIAAVNGDGAEFDSLATLALDRYPDSERRFELRALQASVHGDSVLRRMVIEELRGTGAASAPTAAWSVASYSGDVAGAIDFARALADPAVSREAGMQGLGDLYLAHLHLALGRWRDARVDLERAETLAPAYALEYRALLSLFPFLPESASALQEQRAIVERWDAARVPRSATRVVWIPHDGVHTALRAYLLGMLDARLGDGGGAVGLAEDLESLKVPRHAESLVTNLARSVRAQVALAEGNPADAISLLESAQLTTWYNLAHASSFFSQTYERFALAELLREAGRFEEALRWYSTFEQHSAYDLVYLAPSHFRRAEIYEALGDVKRASDHYSRVIELWHDADGELQPWVEKARQRKDALVGAS